jgi:hypothetical protein
MTTPADFAAWTDRAAGMTLAQLDYSARDCRDAASAVDSHNPVAATRYMDEMAVYCQEINRRCRM